jgi:hypothetical protein
MRGMIVERIFSQLRNIKISLFLTVLILVMSFFTLFMSVSAEILPSFRSPQQNDLPPGMLAFKSYSAPQGLTNLSIWALEQDVDGFLWVGTVDGLFRYDGSRGLLLQENGNWRRLGYYHQFLRCQYSGLA